MNKKISQVVDGSRVRLIHPFVNGKRQVFQAGSLGVKIGEPNKHLFTVQLDGYAHPINPLRIHVEPI